jgi:hypothetical protein
MLVGMAGLTSDAEQVYANNDDPTDGSVVSFAITALDECSSGC